MKNKPLLTEAQRAVMAEIIKGNTTAKEIAKALACSPTTVHCHLSAIYHRLGVDNKTSAVVKYLAPEIGKKWDSG